MSNQSEVAYIRQQIEAECFSAWQALYGTAQGTCSHNFIHARYENLGRLGDQLGQLVGEDTAIDIIADAMDSQAPQ